MPRIVLALVVASWFLVNDTTVTPPTEFESLFDGDQTPESVRDKGATRFAVSAVAIAILIASIIAAASTGRRENRPSSTGGCCDGCRLAALETVNALERETEELKTKVAGLLQARSMLTQANTQATEELFQKETSEKRRVSERNAALGLAAVLLTANVSLAKSLDGVIGDLVETCAKNADLRYTLKCLRERFDIVTSDYRILGDKNERNERKIARLEQQNKDLRSALVESSNRVVKVSRN